MTDAPGQTARPDRARIDAYIDGRLTPRDRIVVESWLAQTPEAAAGVMAELRLRDELRLALEPVGAPAPETVAAGRRLASALRTDRHAPRLARVAAVAAVFGMGWLAHAGFGPLSVRGVEAALPPPAWLSAALSAHRTSEMRAGMASQEASATLDRAEIRAATGLYLPSLPEGWRLRDVQIFPSDFGPSVEAAFATPQGILSLFAVRPGSFAVARPAEFAAAGLAAAHFQIGDAAYVLVAPEGADLTQDAARLFDSLH